MNHAHGKSLQEISSLIKRPREESRALGYQVYDMVLPGMSYLKRHKALVRVACELTPRGFFIFGVLTKLIHDQEELNAFHAENLDDGSEGTIVRWGDAGYENGKRSKSLLKVKNFQDAEFEIISFGWGKPYIRAGREYRVPIFRCKTTDGKEFDVTAHGTMEEKDAIANEVHRYIGAYLTVKYFNLTPDGVPFLPVALRFYDVI